VLNRAATPEPISRPTATLACWKLPKKPRRSGGRPFDDEGGRAAPFATGGEALHEPADHQQDRGEDADRRPGRDEADADGADRHHEDGQDEGRLTPAHVADAADHDAAHGPGHEADAEGGESGEQRADLVCGREEGLRDDGGQIAVDREIVPFQDVADDGGADSLPGFHRTPLRDGKHRRSAIDVASRHETPCSACPSEPWCDHISM
jgi:hypothetical protein